MTKLIKLLILLLVLTISACKTIEYVYPDYPYPEMPTAIYYDKELLYMLMQSMTIDQKKTFAAFLKDIDDKQLEWENWADKVKELTTNDTQ